MGSEVNREVAIRKFHGTEAHLQAHVPILADKVLNSFENCRKSVVYDIFAHLTGCSYWHCVGVNGAESLLVDGLLATRRRDLLFAVVPVQVVLQLALGDETRLKVMAVLADFPLCMNVMTHVYILTIVDLGEVGVDVKDEGAELANINASTFRQLTI